MIGYKDLRSLLNLIVEWEKKLADFYDVAEYALRKKESLITVKILKENHDNNMKVLESIDVEEFGNDEWIKYTPDFNVHDIMPIGKISRDASPDEIIHSILEFEEKVKEYYEKIADKIITSQEKDLFDSLVSFKNTQIVRIKQLLEFI